MLSWNLVRKLKVLSSASAFRRAGLESYTRWQVSSFDLKDGLYTELWFNKAVTVLMPVWRGRENISQMLMLCVSPLFCSFSAPPCSIVERAAGPSAATGPRTYLDTGAAITDREIERCLFCVNMSAATPGPECKHTHTHTLTHTQIHSQPRSLNHHPAPVENECMISCLSLFASLFLILSSVTLNLSLCFVWYGAAPMHFYSLSYIAFFIHGHLCPCVCKFVFFFLFCEFRLCVCLQSPLCV